MKGLLLIIQKCGEWHMKGMYEQGDLKTNRLILTKIHGAHAADLFEVYSNAETATYVPRKYIKRKRKLIVY